MKTIIIGGGGHAKSVISAIEKSNELEIVGYVDKKNKGKVLGAPYLGKDEDLPAIKKKHSCKAAVIGVGTKEISDKRAVLKKLLEKLGFILPVIISPTATVNQGVEIKKGTVVLDGAIINVDTKIGECAIINTGAVIEHDCVIGDFAHVAPGAVLCGGVSVGEGSLVSAGSTVIQYKRIGAGCLIGAGAVAVDDCLKPGTYMGIPAKKKS